MQKWSLDWQFMLLLLLFGKKIELNRIKAQWQTLAKNIWYDDVSLNRHVSTLAVTSDTNIWLVSNAVFVMQHLLSHFCLYLDFLHEYVRHFRFDVFVSYQQFEFCFIFFSSFNSRPNQFGSSPVAVLTVFLQKFFASFGFWSFYWWITMMQSGCIQQYQTSHSW